ncbi:MAG: hypothetical protein CMO57_02200 [Verrucomicrobiales bacterium]|nr:hypothetical protein [Verrucomicrobiales bacterium]
MTNYRIMKNLIIFMFTVLVCLGCKTSKAVLMHQAAFYGDAKVVQEYLNSGLDPNSMTLSGTTSLHSAAYRGNANIIELLLKNGANPNMVDGRGWIPLHQAVDQGHVGVVDMLIQSGSNVNAVMGASGYTALDWSVIRQWPKVSDLIRKHGGKKITELHLSQ